MTLAPFNHEAVIKFFSIYIAYTLTIEYKDQRPKEVAEEPIVYHSSNYRQPRSAPQAPSQSLV